jgi:hypothetical protein
MESIYKGFKSRTFNSRRCLLFRQDLIYLDLYWKIYTGISKIEVITMKCQTMTTTAIASVFGVSMNIAQAQSLPAHCIGADASELRAIACRLFV